jgi:hypothetical protein
MHARNFPVSGHAVVIVAGARGIAADTPLAILGASDGRRSSAQSSKVPGDVLGENFRESLPDWETDAA